MKGLTKEQRKDRDDLAQRIRDSAAALSTEFDELISAIQKFNAAIDEHNGLLDEAREWRNDVAAEIDTFMSEKSEKWLDGDRGQAFAEWKDGIENLDLDDLEPIEEPDQPDAETAADTLDQMQEEPAS